MLNGVRIINRHEVRYNDKIFTISMSVFALLIVASVTVGMFSIAFAKMRSLAIILIAITIMAGFFQFFVYTNTVKHFNIYTVIVDDSVGFNDFYSKYKIIKEIGNGVFEIRDREQQK